MSTAGVLVIGNEVLSGKVEEENARYLVRELRALGVDLQRIVVVRDDVDTIAEDLRAMAARFTWVFTSGGVGSTHDDVTLSAVAKAFDVPLREQPEVLALLESYFKERMNDAVRRMAWLPEGTTLEGLGELPFPVMRVRNVYVFPGVPRYLRMKFEYLKAHLKVEQPFVLSQLFLRVTEDRLAIPFAREAARFPDLDFGSYPQLDDAEVKTKLTVEGRDPARVAEAFHALLEWLDPGWVVRTEPPTV